MPNQFFLGALLAFLIAVLSYAFRFLTLSGSVATCLLGCVVFGFGGWQWGVPIVTFFVLSSMLTRFGRRRKEDAAALFEKSGTRDWGQVVSNGGIAGVLVVASSVLPSHDLYPLYLGCVAAVTADTWGTEIGTLSQGRTVSALTWKPVPPGTSGGISEMGTLAGVIGAAVIAATGYPWYEALRTGGMVILAGVAGSFADSVLGATLQAQFTCVVCGKATERRIHCGVPTQHQRGMLRVNNDVVNLLCGLVGAAVAWGLSFL